MGRKPPVSPSLTTKFPSEAVKTWDNPSKIFRHEKTPETMIFRGFLHVRWSRSALAELRRTTGGLEAVFKSSEWRFPLIFQGFSGYSTKIAPPFNHKNGGTLSTHGRGKCGIYNAQKVFGLIILHLRIDVHSCLAVFMPRKILNCLWINASIQKIGNVGMP